MYACSTNCDTGRQDAEKRSAENKATRTARRITEWKNKVKLQSGKLATRKNARQVGSRLAKKRFRASLNLPQQQQQQKQQQQQQHSIAAGEVLEGSVKLSSLSLCQLLARSPGELLHLTLSFLRRTEVKKSTHSVQSTGEEEKEEQQQQQQQQQQQ